VILALRALGLGDLLTAVPALRALARAFPGDRRVLAGPAWLAPLVPGGWELVDVPACVAGRPPTPPLAARLPHGALAVNLHGRGPESTRLLLATRPARLVAFRSEGVEGPAFVEGEHDVARWCRLLAESGIAADPADLDVRHPPVARDPSLTLIHPGAASPARRWPAARWASVARAELAAGHRVLVTGSHEEAPLARRVAAQADLPLDAIRTGIDLAALIELVATAGRLACGDTGVAHLATALRTPSVIVFGPVSPRRWGPPPDRPWHRALWAGRTGDPHAATPDPGLLAIAPAEVIAALHGLPAAFARGAAG
jgi:ADP-heptose:LPS heptosyltransferase